MQVEINPDSLIDSPYSKSKDDFFDFDVNQLNDLRSDIIKAPHTCYLVSGYRGSGKTSFIKRLEDSFSEPKTIISSTKETVRDEPFHKGCFVYTSFAKVDDKMHLMRMLIRETYLKISTQTKIKELLSDQLKHQLELLYKRTFFEVTGIEESGRLRETTMSLSVSISEFIRKVMSRLMPVIAIALIFLYNYKLMAQGFIIGIALSYLCLWAIASVVSSSFIISWRTVFSNKLFTKTLYDDEIAATLFFNLLKDLKEANIKMVFVLDELDKVKEDELQVVIRELKPCLVSGYATFIVVGGQDFYYKFQAEQHTDDGILSSLFSKTVHIPLSSYPILKDRFNRSVVKKAAFENLSEKDKKELEIYVNYLIFCSRLIPRRFIGLIRQNIIWEEGRAYLVNKSAHHLAEACSELIKAIDYTDSNKISRDHSGAVRDYIISKMYLNVHGFFFTRNRPFTKHEFGKEQF